MSRIRHRMFYTYARGRVRVQCRCGNAQTPWMPSDSTKPVLKRALAKAHPRVQS